MQAIKSTLLSGIDSERSKTTNLSKEVEHLNKEITQGRILLGNLKKQYESEHLERTDRLEELKQRHLDEHKEKQSVKICDIKEELKRQRESALQEKRIQCSRSLDECNNRLRSQFSDLLKDHQRKLSEDAHVIAQLQDELRRLTVNVVD